VPRKDVRAPLFLAGTVPGDPDPLLYVGPWLQCWRTRVARHLGQRHGNVSLRVPGEDEMYFTAGPLRSDGDRPGL